MDPWGLLLRHCQVPNCLGKDPRKIIVKFKQKCFLETPKSRLQQWILLPIKVSKFMWILWMKVTPNMSQNCNKIKYFLLNSAISLSTLKNESISSSKFPRFFLSHLRISWSSNNLIRILVKLFSYHFLEFHNNFMVIFSYPAKNSDQIPTKI